MATPAKLKRGPASLVGGVATGLCVLGLWLAIEFETGAVSGLTTGFGVLVAACVAAWVRIADL
ncbi:MAG: hypothetical protein ACREF1_03230 [Acetobacteraceae bacterium]